jgi:hypothetical protein
VSPLGSDPHELQLQLAAAALGCGGGHAAAALALQAWSERLAESMCGVCRTRVSCMCLRDAVVAARCAYGPLGEQLCSAVCCGCEGAHMSLLCAAAGAFRQCCASLVQTVSSVEVSRHVVVTVYGRGAAACRRRVTEEPGVCTMHRAVQRLH